MAGNQSEQFNTTLSNVVGEVLSFIGGGRTASRSIPNSRTKRAVISSVNGDGTYAISVVGADSEDTQFSLDGVKPWGNSTHTVGEHVLIAYEGKRPLPWIISGAGATAGSGSDTLIVGFIRFFSTMLFLSIMFIA